VRVLITYLPVFIPGNITQQTCHLCIYLSRGRCARKDQWKRCNHPSQ